MNISQALVKQVFLGSGGRLTAKATTLAVPRLLPFAVLIERLLHLTEPSASACSQNRGKPFVPRLDDVCRFSLIFTDVSSCSLL